MMFRNFLVTVLFGAFLNISTVTAANDVTTCLAGDHYRTADTDYVACGKAMQQTNLPDKMLSQVLAGFAEAAYFKYRDNEALLPLHQALKLDPENQDARLRRAWTYYHLKQYQEMRDDLTVLLDKNPDNPDALFALGSLYKYSPDWQTTAIPAFKRALEINPNHYLTRYNLALIYAENFNRFDMAIVEYDKILEASDEELSKVKSRYFQGGGNFSFKDAMIFEQLKLQQSYEGIAVRFLEVDRLVQQYPRIAGLFALRANYNQIAGKPEEAIADGNIALDLSPSEDDVKFTIAKALFDLRRWQVGLDLTSSINCNRCNNFGVAQVYYWRSLFQKKLKNYDAAFKDLDQAIQIEPDTSTRLALTQVIQYGYYKGKFDDKYSEEIRNSIKACIIDPECGL